MTDSQISQLKDFLALARHGGHGAASSGERAAHALAAQAATISGLMQDMDAEKQEGYLHLLRGLAWPDTRDMLLAGLPKAPRR